MDNFIRAKALAEKLGVTLEENDSVQSSFIVLLEAILRRIESVDRAILHHMGQHQKQEEQKLPTKYIHCDCGRYIDASLTYPSQLEHGFDNLDIVVCSCGKPYRV